jgi:hypothetical protein
MFTDVTDQRTASMFRVEETNLTMEAVRSSETSINIYQTTGRHISEDNGLLSASLPICPPNFNISLINLTLKKTALN